MEAAAAAGEPLVVEEEQQIHLLHYQQISCHYSIEDVDDHEDEDEDDDVGSSPPFDSSSSWEWDHAHCKKKIQRCKTAPAMAVMKDCNSRSRNEDHPSESNSASSSSSASLVRQAALLLLFYLFFGVLIYSFNRENFSGIETHPVVDALYFCIVTMCTIGYGDITPSTPLTKLFACLFVLVGFGFIDILLTAVLNYFLDLQESLILVKAKVKANKKKPSTAAGMGLISGLIVDVAKGRMRIRMKVGVALGVVVLCIATGALVLYYVERLDWVDSLYLAVMSVTTVGYGDRAFKTLQGRLFASVWLLLSTLAVARAFLYLAEARIDKRHRMVANWVLHRSVTVGDFLAADINNNGHFISKSEYIVFKLKEMGKIREKDIVQICDRFNKLDRNKSGKITLPDLLENHL